MIERKPNARRSAISTKSCSRVSRTRPRPTAVRRAGPALRTRRQLVRNHIRGAAGDAEARVAIGEADEQTEVEPQHRVGVAPREAQHAAALEELQMEGLTRVDDDGLEADFGELERAADALG